MRKIAVEEHAGKQDLEHLDKRLKDMDEAGIDMQVLSFSPEIAEGLDTAGVTSYIMRANDKLAEIVEKHPERFAADYPPESALEAAQFIESAPISDSDKEKICHLNAEKLLSL